MPRRTRSRSSARRRTRTGRGRTPGQRPGSKNAAGKPASTPAGARVVPLTAARRRAVERRRQGRTPPSIGTTIDFHVSAAVACARAGGRVVMDFWGKRGAYLIHEKGRNDFVTIVDRRAEEAIVALIRGRFPDHAILAEESASASEEPARGVSSGRANPGPGPTGLAAAPSGYRWYIDPLDGTTNYIHGYPFFGVSVGLADPQGLRAAAVYDPLRDEMFTAARGQGAFLNGKPIRVARAEKLSQALLVTGFPFRSIDRLDEYLATFKAFVLGSTGIRRDGSAALDLAYVACGRYDGFWEMNLSPWDVAAGSLLVREAGGVVTDLQGQDGFLSSGDILAANVNVHPAMLRITRQR